MVSGIGNDPLVRTPAGRYISRSLPKIAVFY
jgi:hypothetical protein